MPGVAEQIARAPSDFELGRTGRMTEAKLAPKVANASLILTNLPKRDWCHLIEERPKVIGCSDNVDIPLPVRFCSVSPHHAQVWRDHRGHWIQDLGSTGTRVNMVWIGGLSRAKIVPSDVINLGDQVQMQMILGKPTSDGGKELAEEVSGGPPHDDLTVCLGPGASRRQMVHGNISPAETELLLWISRGFLDNEDLGRRLHRSPHTVRTQIGSILRKLGLHSRGEIIPWLLRRAPGAHAPRPAPFPRSR
jgi:DNA-binding CsgD family transcriptional regulator